MSFHDDKFDAIDGANAKFFESLAGVDQQLAREIIKIYAKFVVGDALFLDAEQMAQLENTLISAVAKTDYKLAVDAYIPNFDVINELNKAIHKQENNINIQAVIEENRNIKNYVSSVESQLRGTAKTFIRTLNEAGEEVIVDIPNKSLEQLIDPIAEIIRRDVITGISFEDATVRILEAIEKKELGLERWADQIARDALNQADGITQQAVKDEFNMTMSRYVGTIVEGTRPICHHLLTAKENRVYTDNELKKVLDEYIPNGVPSTTPITYTTVTKTRTVQKGGGMIPGTSVANFHARRGGYRCRHQFTPVFKIDESEELMPEAQAESFVPAKNIKEAESRMRDLGVKIFRSNGFGLDHANAVIESLEKVPIEARPDIVSNFSEFGKIIGRKLSVRENTNYGVTINMSEIKLNKIELTEEIRKQYKILESQWSDTATVFTEFNLEGKSFNILAINTRKYKKPESILNRKRNIEKIFTEKGERYYIDSAFSENNFTHIHEMGHIFDKNKLITGRNDSINEALDRWYSESKIGHLAYNKSEFGRSGYKEAFADAFADYYLTGGKNLPDYLLKELDKILK